jgi:aromatic amino acid aminotransferase I
MSPPSIQDVGVHATSDTTAVTIPDPLTCDDVTARRSKSGPFKGGVAASTSSEFFKSKVSSVPAAFLL